MDDTRLDCIIQYLASPDFWFADLYRQAAETYAPELTVSPNTASGGSDWYPFAALGYPAVGAAEQARTSFNPHYHSITDRIETLSPELYTAITRASVATLITMGICPGMVEDVCAQDMGDGSALSVRWSANPEPDLTGYRLWWGTASQAHTDSAWVPGAETTSYLLSGLIADTPHYLVVRAQDTDGHTSFRATEVVATPHLIPQAPSGVAATPIPGGIRVDWFPNGEADIAGYRVLRRTNEGPYDLVADCQADTTFTDPNLSGTDRYYYRVEALDSEGNASMPSTEAYGRPMTLDQGILVVDETRNYTAVPDSLQDSFYHAILQGFTTTEYEYGSASQAPVLSDCAPYSTVVWHADDFAQFLAAGHVSDLATYLDAGGNVWLIGWKLSANLSGSSVYPMAFEAGSFMYNYVGVDHVALSGTSDSLQAVNGEAGYPDLPVDGSKIPTPSWGTTLRYIESLNPLAGTEAIYRADMANGGAFDGTVCGIRRIDTGPKVVFFAFPLYFMDEAAARHAARVVLTGFGEPLAAATASVCPRLVLDASPNPFEARTTLSFAARNEGKAKVAVFDIAGHLVATLLDTQVASGRHTVIWDGTDTAGTPVGSGIYLCRLEAPGGHAVRRVLLLR
ncbi:T9SS type A sorting domain-containing protein, partial [Candidatus Fermentibacteria bacterium]|nr:T9SS type A sorting domain-containing protein [Candidatus Fermentibacteria bacterium]